MRVLVKRILKKYGYPPDLADEAVQTVLAQAEILLRDLFKRGALKDEQLDPLIGDHWSRFSFTLRKIAFRTRRSEVSGSTMLML